jgi:hydrogenase maturation protease
MGNSPGKGKEAGVAGASVPATLVLGLGNPLRGDDGVGVRVAQQLAEWCLPSDVEVVDAGTRGLGLVSLLEGRRRAIVIDASDMGLAPGEFVRFTLEEARLLGEDEGRFSVHAAGLREALLLARALGILPEEVVLFGVQPAHVAWEAGLSPQVETTLLGLAEAVRREVMAGDPPTTEPGASGIEGYFDRQGLLSRR